MTTKEHSESTEFQFQDSRQRDIHELLTRLAGPGPAAFFRDACDLASGTTPMQSSSHLAAHSVREVESAIRDVLLPFGSESERVPKTATTAVRPKQGENHSAEVRKILSLLEMSEEGHVGELWLKVAGNGIADRAHRAALEGPRPLDQEFMEFWDKMQAILLEVLKRFERRVTDITRPLLDALLKKTVPSKKDIQRLRNNIPASSVLRHSFFEKIGPSWLMPLADAGFFENPTPPERVTPTLTRFPPWPLSKYLVRMASGDRATQRLALSVALSIPKTDNVSVRADLAELSQKLPMSLAIQLVPTYLSLLSTSQYLQYEPITLSKFALQLARSGRIRLSLRLMSELLAVMPDPTYLNSARENVELPPRPRWRAYDWDRESLHNEILPAMVDAGGIGMLRILARRLKQAVDLSMIRGERKRRASKDFSPIWLPSLASFEETNHDVEVELAQALASGAIRIANRNPRDIRGVVKVLQRKRWSIFDRIRLCLLTSTDRIDRQLVAEALLDIRLIEDEHVRVEYTGLLKARFASLGARQQERLLEVLASRGLSAGESRTLSIDERALRRDRLILGRLQLVERHLKGRWRKRYEALRARTSSPIRWDDPNPTVEVSVGDRSPLDIEELKKLDVSQIVDYLRSWQPPEGEWEASPDGLGRVLTVVVEHNAARFSEAASQFRELDPTYISWLLHGLHAAVRAGTPLVWEPVVSLCAWVVAQPRDEKAWRRSRYSDLDPGWAWTRKAVATLISDGLRQPSQALPIHLRQNVGNVLNILCEDPHPTREDENRHGGDAMDAYQFSVNATRSEALEALIAYALWVQSSLTKLEDSGRTFDLVPDARAILDRHLDPEYDPSRAVRATYGRWFGNLYYADAKWAVENIAKIFPREPDREGLRVAAWESFLWNRPHAAIYKALQGEYELAIERMNMTVKRNAHTRDPRARLGIHLSILFISGGLPVKDAHVISDFFANAPVDIRTAVIADVARNLRQSPTLPATTLERVKELWNLRLNAVGITDNSDLGTFGEWFASERIEDDWGYPHLAAALSQGGRLPGGHNVIKKLAKDAAHRTTQALDCLDLIIDGEKSEWHIEFWKDDITTVLRTGLASALDSDRRRARETANRLVARGYASYSELLANIQPDSSG